MEPVRIRLDSRPKEEVYKLLIDSADKFGLTVMDDICRNIYLLENVEYLMKFFRLESKEYYRNWHPNIWNCTPLHIAASASNYIFFKELIKLGFDKNKKNNKGLTALDILLENRKKLLHSRKAPNGKMSPQKPNPIHGPKLF